MRLRRKCRLQSATTRRSVRLWFHGSGDTEPYWNFSGWPLVSEIVEASSSTKTECFRMKLAILETRS